LLEAIGYLIAKLPGYAADEILAVGSLIVRPGLIIAARKVRKKQRFVSARVIAEFIPPRWSQIRLASEGVVDAVRAKLFPENNQISTSSVLDTNEDEDLLTPVSTNHWFGVFKRPEVIGFVLISLISLLNSRNRFGALVGGALPISPAGATDLWRTYFESWHQVGMGSTVATPNLGSDHSNSIPIFLGKSPILDHNLLLGCTCPHDVYRLKGFLSV
jgi:hypothetical protein